MPKAPGVPLEAAQSSAPSSVVTTVLKRNQACHQCRKRKLKCDALRPCGTCKRSHRNALTHAEPGVVVPPEPDCSYDDVLPSTATNEGGPRSRFEKLESRMRELEAMVREKEQYTQQLLQQLGPAGAPEAQAQPSFQPTPGPSTFTSPADPMIPLEPFVVGSMSGLTDLYSSMSASGSNANNAPPPPVYEPFPEMDIFFSQYPPRLPPPDLLHHLVDVFFNFFVHANRVLHRPSFQASLTLPPSSIGFPKASLLHAICAIASSFTSLVEQPPLPDYKQQSGVSGLFKTPQPPVSFGDMHAKYAKEALEGAIQSGDGIFEAFQSMLLLSCFNFRQAKWVESWLLSGLALRSLTPLGLNVCEPHVPLRRSLAPIFLLPPPRDSIEEEIRRNCFWLAYTMERFQTVGTGWAATLDDEDISQVLPTPLENFINGIRVPASIRQRLSTAAVLTTHPHGQTDSFTIYVKAAHLLSVIKSFNHRIMSKLIPISDEIGRSHEPDARLTQEFHGVEQVVLAFGQSMQRHFRKPVIDGMVDSHLYVASIASNLGIVVLHAPHMKPHDPADSSGGKVLSACRAILESVFAICNTSYDLGLLDSFCSMAWIVPAQEMLRLSRARIEAGDMGSALQLRADIEVFRVALQRMAERVPVAYRRLIVLEEALKSELDPLLGGGTNTSVEEIPTIQVGMAHDGVQQFASMTQEVN